MCGCVRVYLIIYIPLSFQFEVELKGNLVKNLETHYDGQLDTGDTFSRAIDWAQVYVSMIEDFLVPVKSS